VPDLGGVGGGYEASGLEPISMGGWVPSFRTMKVTGGAIMRARANWRPPMKA